jgi:hypothetical protein
MISIQRLTFLLTLLLSLSRTLAEDAYYDNGNNADAADDDGVQSYDDNYVNDDNQSSNYIKYWTEYALLPKRCIV